MVFHYRAVFFFVHFQTELLSSQGAEGIPVPYSSEDPLYDQLASFTPTGHHSAHCLLVSGGLDICCLSEPGQEVGTH